MLRANYKTLTTKPLYFLILYFVSVFAHAGAFERLFAPEAVLQEAWLAHDKTSTQKIDHHEWNDFLARHVKQDSQGINRVTYASVSESEQRALQSYINAMQNIPISRFSRDEQLAYWINLYNAVTVNVVLMHYPVASIRDIDISPGFFSDGPWGKKLLQIENKALSLNDIEHGILRPIWKDARIHYAVNCASVSCPDLSNKAYSSAGIDQQLDEAAKQYIAHPRAVRFTDEGVVVSSIYSWFQNDFGQQEADVIKHLQKYADDEMINKLNGIQFFADDEYDWSLNDASVKAP